MRSFGTVAFCMSLLPSLAWGDIFVIVSASNPIPAMSQKDVVDIYMGRKRTFPTGEYAFPLDMPRDGPLRQRFYAAMTGMSLSQVNGYWSRLVFTGQVLPPQPLPDTNTMLEVVRRNPGAIGYVDVKPHDPGIKVVFEWQEPAN